MDEETINIRDYFDVLMKRRWVILACAVIIFITVAIGTFLAQPVYKATVRISIERENPQIMSIQEVLQVDASESDYLLSQVDILKSRSLANDVILRLNLEQSPEFVSDDESGFFSPLVWARSIVGAVVEFARSLLFEDSREDERTGSHHPLYSQLTGAYLTRLTAEPVRRTRLVDVSFEGYDPRIVADIANSHVQAYIDKNLDLRFQATQDALVWLNQKLVDVKNTLTTAENALQRFREQEDIISLGDIMSLSQRGDSLVQQRIQELSTALTAARIERINLENTQQRLQELKRDQKSLLESFPEMISNQLINNLKQSLAETLRKKSELREKYGERHPTIVAINAEIMQQEKRLLREIESVSQSVSTRYDIALGRERSLTNEMEREKDRARDLTRKALQYSVLQREVESNKQLYDTLLTRVKETALTSGLDTSNVKIIDRADVPGSPAKPNKKMNLLLGLIVGMGAGIGLAFFLDHLDDSIESPDDIEKHLNVPFLGAMGYVKNIKKGDSDNNGRGELFSLDDPKSQVSEAVRNIRTNISFRLRGRGEKSFIVTSTNPGEGKTIFSSNMAVMFATMGKRTVFVGTDMRKARSHELFGMHRSPGLSDALIGETTFDEVIRENIIPGLYYVPAGTAPPNPSELLTSERMAEFHAVMEERFDIVIYDTPPIMSVTDALVMSQIARNVVLVVESGSTDRKAAKHAVKQLNEMEARILGIVLNEAKVTQDSYYGRYYRYYRRYYHYDYYVADDGERKRRRRA